MPEFILKLYDYMRMHRMTCFFSFVVITLLLVMSVLRLGYKEDIADFLPIDSEHHNALKYIRTSQVQTKSLLFSSIVILLRRILTPW